MQLPAYISDLLYKYDCITIPEFGAFLAQYESAAINTQNNVFNPPQKAILFNEQIKGNDGLLTRYIADVEKIPFETAKYKIEKQVQFYKTVLSEGETLVFDGIGELVLNSDGQITFEPSKDVNYLTESFGLAPIATQSIEQPTTVVEPVEETPVVKIEKSNRPYLKYAAVGLIALSLAGLAGAKYNANRIEHNNELVIKEAQSTIDSTIQEATFVIENPLPTVTLSVKKAVIGNYHIVAGAFRVEANCDKKIEELREKGFDARKVGKNKFGLHQVAYSSYVDRLEALKALRTIKKTVAPSAWLLVKTLK